MQVQCPDLRTQLHYGSAFVEHVEKLAQDYRDGRIAKCMSMTH